MFYYEEMRRREDKENARILRKEGKSYAEIKSILKVGKSTLSAWLNDMPLSLEQIRNLRDLNPKRIENYRNTMRAKREVRLATVFGKATKDIGRLSERDIFIAGLFLYWGEGTKATRSSVTLSNTNPAMMRFFIKWLKMMGVSKDKLKVRLHLYSDMDVEKEVAFWSSILDLSASQFRSPYIKESKLAHLTYKNGFGHGTCNLTFENVPLWEYIMMALKRMEDISLGA